MRREKQVAEQWETIAMSTLNHLLRAVVLLASFLCLSHGCGKSESPTADPEPFKAAVAQYLEQNNMAMALKQIKTGPTTWVSSGWTHFCCTARRVRLG